MFTGFSDLLIIKDLVRYESDHSQLRFIFILLITLLKKELPVSDFLLRLVNLTCT